MANILTIKNTKNNFILGNKIYLANNSITRLSGLMGKESFGEIDGMLIKPCNSIHTFFMKFPIDVIFISKDNKIIRVVENLKEWKISPIVFKAHSTLELPIKTIEKTNSEVGDILEISKKNFS